MVRWSCSFVALAAVAFAPRLAFGGEPDPAHVRVPGDSAHIPGESAQIPGESAEIGLALCAGKALLCKFEGPVAIDDVVVLVRGGVIEAVGKRKEVAIPSGYVVRELGSLWLAPGMIDLHSHGAMSLRDLSETVFLTNPEMRASVGVVPGFDLLGEAVAGGVTTVLHIPGSATNMGGAGVLLRTGGKTYEEMLVRDPGSLKLAQSGNPERRGPWLPQRSLMNWNTRNTFARGVAYAKRWVSYELGIAPKPERDLQFDVFRSLVKGEAQVSTHTQIYQVVRMTLTMISDEFGLPVYIDHGSFDSHRNAADAQKRGISAIVGPRQISLPYNRPTMTIDQDGAIWGVAAKHQEAGHKMIGFNTDSVGPPGADSVGPQELSHEAGMGVRYGFKNEDGAALRGLTIVPATTAGIADRVGSIEVGKDADLIATTGDPTDPRTSVELVLMRGRIIYDTTVDQRRF